MSKSRNIKQQAHSIIDALPDSADWDDVMYDVYLRQAVEAGERDVAGGKTLSDSEVRARLTEKLHRH